MTSINEVAVLMVYENKKWVYMNNDKSYETMSATLSADECTIDLKKNDNVLLKIVHNVKYVAKGNFHQFKQSGHIYALKFKEDSSAEAWNTGFSELLHIVKSNVKTKGSSGGPPPPPINTIPTIHHTTDQPKNVSPPPINTIPTMHHTTDQQKNVVPPPPKRETSAPPPPPNKRSSVPPPPPQRGLAASTEVPAPPPPSRLPEEDTGSLSTFVDPLAPPPPPPPPAAPSDSTPSGGGPVSLSDALKGAKLKKVEPSKTEVKDKPTPSSSNSGGGGEMNMMAEMANMLKRRQQKLTQASENTTKESVPNTTNVIRKQSTRDGVPETKNFGRISASKKPAVNVASTQKSEPIADNTNVGSDQNMKKQLEEMKEEIMASIKQELQAFKAEILDALKK